MAESNRASNNDAALEYRWEEYKLLQEKIDKIASYCFQVKYWVVVIISAIVVSGYAAKLPWWTMLSAVPIIANFGFFELYERKLQKRFADRARILEEEMRNANPHIFSKARNYGLSAIKDPNKISPISPADAVNLVTLKLRKSFLGKVILHSTWIFYGLAIFLIIAASVLSIFRVEKAQQIEVRSPIRLLDDDNSTQDLSTDPNPKDLGDLTNVNQDSRDAKATNE